MPLASGLQEVRPGRHLYFRVEEGLSSGRFYSKRLVVLLAHGAGCHHAQVEDETNKDSNKDPVDQ